MKEIKRYDYDEYYQIIDEEIEGSLVKYTDHKAVVETMQNRIDDLLLIADHRWAELKKS